MQNPQFGLRQKQMQPFFSSLPAKQAQKGTQHKRIFASAISCISKTYLRFRTLLSELTTFQRGSCSSLWNEENGPKVLSLLIEAKILVFEFY